MNLSEQWSHKAVGLPRMFLTGIIWMYKMHVQCTMHKGGRTKVQRMYKVEWLRFGTWSVCKHHNSSVGFCVCGSDVLVLGFSLLCLSTLPSSEFSLISFDSKCCGLQIRFKIPQLFCQQLVWHLFIWFLSVYPSIRNSVCPSICR